MNLSKIGGADAFLIALIALTSAMWLHDRLPASRAEIAGVEALAASNENAQRVVASRLSDDPKPSKGEARRLRERVVAIEASASRPPVNGVTQRLDFERERLAALPFRDMGNLDKFRWVLLGLGRYSELLIGSFIGLCALIVTRKRWNGSGMRRSYRQRP
jgi:hypothetical protein